MTGKEAVKILKAAGFVIESSASDWVTIYIKGSPVQTAMACKELGFTEGEQDFELWNVWID